MSISESSTTLRSMSSVEDSSKSDASEYPDTTDDAADTQSKVSSSEKDTRLFSLP